MGTYSKQTLEERKAYHAAVEEGFRCCFTESGPMTGPGQIPINHPMFSLVVTPQVGPTGTVMAQTFYYLATVGVHDVISWPALGAMVGIPSGKGGGYGVHHALCNAFYRMMHYLKLELTHGYLFVPSVVELDVQYFKRKWSSLNDAAWEVWSKG